MSWLRFLFSWNGRVGPTGYAMGWVVNLSVAVATFLLQPSVPLGYRSYFIGTAIVLVALSLLSFVFRRYHDLGQKVPVKVAVMEIPGYTAMKDLTEMFRLFIAPGDPNENKHGPPPKF
ncbi:MAG: hypothetical protein DHS20C11_06180 [Lysobacteraceae bacterium]|nr:MAG: hypothetical protein DHS20C11_06180 [Xanthomonadaceae bacterium]